MAQQMKELPADWGDDKLSEHVRLVHGNSMFVFEARKAAWKRLQEIDEIFLRLLDGPPREVISFFFFLCHSAYRAAVVLGSDRAGKGSGSFLRDEPETHRRFGLAFGRRDRSEIGTDHSERGKLGSRCDERRAGARPAPTAPNEVSEGAPSVILLGRSAPGGGTDREKRRRHDRVEPELAS